MANDTDILDLFTDANRFTTRCFRALVIFAVSAYLLTAQPQYFSSVWPTAFVIAILSAINLTKLVSVAAVAILMILLVAPPPLLAWLR